MPAAVEHGSTISETRGVAYHHLVVHALHEQLCQCLKTAPERIFIGSLDDDAMTSHLDHIRAVRLHPPGKFKFHSRAASAFLQRNSFAFKDFRCKVNVSVSQIAS